MKNNFLRFLAGFLIGLLFLTVFLLFFLNTVTVELKMGSIYEVTRQIFRQREEFKPDQFGHQIGLKIFDPAYGGEVIKVEPQDFQTNGQNYINTGPGIILSPGKYLLNYDLEAFALNPGEDFVRIDVFSQSHGVVSEKTLKYSHDDKNFHRVAIEFETAGGKDFEFRVLYLGRGEVKVGKAKIETLTRNYKTLLGKSFAVFGRIKRAL